MRYGLVADVLLRYYRRAVSVALPRLYRYPMEASPSSFEGLTQQLPTCLTKRLIEPSPKLYRRISRV